MCVCGWDFWFWVFLNLRLHVKNSKVVSYRIQFQVVFLLYCEIPKIESIALSSLGWPLRQLPLFSKCGCTFAEIWKPSKFCHEMQSRSPLEFRSLLIPPLEASLWMTIFQVSSIHPSTNIKTTCGASPTTASVMQWNFHKVHRGKRIIS